MPAIGWKRGASRVRKRTVLLGLALTAVAAGVAAWVYMAGTVARDLREAQAQADRLDPGWRLADLIAARSEIPDDENSALQIGRVLQQMPASWPSMPRTFGGAGRPAGVGRDLLTRMDELPRGERLSESLAAAIRAELASHRRAVVEARKLAGMPRGRYPWPLRPNPTLTLMPDQQASRNVARLLRADAILRAHDGDLDGALDSCRAILQCAHAIGDEPSAITQLVRMALVQTAIGAAERVLAQGEPSEAALASLQNLLADEAQHSALLTSLRGERALIDDLFTKLAAGGDGVNALGMPTGLGPRAMGPLSPAFYGHNHALMLRYMNLAVELARRPDAEHLDAWAAWERDFRPPDQALGRWLGGLTYLLAPSMSALGKAHLRERGQLAAAIAMLAAERHRRAHGALPTAPGEIDARFRAGLLNDPYDGRPVRFRPTADGLTIYTVGPDREDNAGRFDPRDRATPGTDQGLTLFLAGRRGRPSCGEWPRDVFQRTPGDETDASP